MVSFRIVGLLSNSVLQGSLLISEERFKDLYPTISGYRMFLAKARPVRKLVDLHETARQPDGNEPARERLLQAPNAQVEFFTITGPGNIVSALESSLSEYGLDATLTSVRLADLLAVQNTYLSTFQSLGALGLLLGTFGLATVQLRSVLERRGELALMRSAGFRRARLAQMVMLENVVLLVGGLLTGVVAATLAVLPHWFAGGAAIPWSELAAYLGIILVVGVVSGLAAVRATLRAPLLGALRGN